MQKDKAKTFNKILEEQPSILVKINEHEMTGQAVVALIEVEPGQIGIMIGGAFDTCTMLHMLRAMEDAKDKLIEQLAHASVESLLKGLSSHDKMKH